ncbi:E3 ubiquitin-protein ligase FANCL [Liparis tanakae]|uniref:E3 ubiquitin-protein ligase FANCL n=1 Tax=Liparis tanakae TaxID=230148 RepID=A0A4Z2EB50_9TELE|nr:E3 ubiquitin-protein ligase FANCL [Liparis tanakae]
MESLLVRDNPLLLPLNKERTAYDGFITERDFRLRVLLPPDRAFKRARLHCCWRLKHLLQGYENIVKQVTSTPHPQTSTHRVNNSLFGSSGSI